MKENIAKILVWRSTAKQYPGHIAFVTYSNDGIDPSKINDTKLRGKEQPGIYVSFWPPADPLSSDGCYKKCKSDDVLLSHFHTEAQDKLVETREPDDVIEIKCIDVAKANEKYITMRENLPPSWKLIPWVSRFFFGSPNEQNCCTLIYDLLKAGGLHNYISVIDKQIKNNFIYGTTIGITAMLSLTTFNTLSRYVTSNTGKFGWNIVGAAAVWIALARVTLSSLRTARVITILTPEDMRQIGDQIKDIPSKKFKPR